jgi:hypothetical protein
MRGPILAILLLPAVAFAGDSPFDGIWKVDPSTYDSISDKPTVIVLQNGTYVPGGLYSKLPWI